MDLGARLGQPGLGRYDKAFRDDAIDTELLPEPTIEDPRGLSVGFVRRRRKRPDVVAALAGAVGEHAARQLPDMLR